MARILYGIHGTGHGHAMRGLTIARQLPEHEFLFVANDDALNIFGTEFAVRTLPNLGTVFSNYKVDLTATIAKAIPILLQKEKYIKQAINIAEEFKPDVCMADLEYFVPQAAKRLNIPCLTLDHQHVITCCEHDLPKDMLFDYYLQGLTPKYLFKPTEYNLIVSFYAPKVRKKYNAIIVPPILRHDVRYAKTNDDGHIVVYQSNTTHNKLIEFLRNSTDRLCYVFGYQDKEERIGNIFFKKKSENAFLELLKNCSYVIQGGGHTLMTESLHLGKPILTLPIMAMIEQRFNALYIERLNYGMQAQMMTLNKELLQNFESKLPSFKQSIANGSFCGNDTVFDIVDKFICTKQFN